MFDAKNTNKLYRYEALLQAIDFFTQKINTMELASYAFEFSNEILTLNSSALYIKEGERFNLIKIRNFKDSLKSIKNTENLQHIATFHGDILTGSYEHFFDNQIIDTYKPKLIIPLIIQDLFYGFIVSDGKAVSEFDEDDLIIARTLMKLINNALENSKNYADLQATNKHLDQKIFNLFSINQSSRILLSELNLNNLYNLAIDIFSELTSSKVTAFGLYDETRQRIILRGYRNVFTTDRFYMEFELADAKPPAYRQVFHYKEDEEILSRIFVNYKDFEKLEAEYIVLIVKDRTLGFVTISKPVNDRHYDESMFELIESLAASTYISFSNAILFEEVQRQRQSAEQKVKVLSKLNKLIKNINSCSDLSELCDITIKTLAYGFGIKKAFIALYENGHYEVKQTLGFETKEKILNLGPTITELKKNETLVKFAKENLVPYFGDNMASDIGNCNCLALSPINVDQNELSLAQNVLGFITVLETSEILKEEEVLLIDTIANSIAPIVNNMRDIEAIKSEYVPDPRAAFKAAFEQKLHNKKQFFITFYIYFKHIPQVPFETPDLKPYSTYESYYFDNFMFVLSEKELPKKLDFDGVMETESLEAFQNHMRTIQKRD